MLGLLHDTHAQAQGPTPYTVTGTFLCSYAAEPLVLVPGANLFIATQDLTSPPDAEGNRAIHCTAISDLKATKDASTGMRILWRILQRVPIPVP